MEKKPITEEDVNSFIKMMKGMNANSQEDQQSEEEDLVRQFITDLKKMNRTSE
jgi:hypothetical protein